MPENDSSIEDRVTELETAQAVQAATFAGAQATQAAGTAGAATTVAAAQAGTWAAMASGAIALILGTFLGTAMTRKR